YEVKALYCLLEATSAFLIDKYAVNF
ncbi:hypothetical protein COK69_22860, partial [Bacillus cereus]